VTELPSDVDETVPHSARIWNYWLGGTDNLDEYADTGGAMAYRNRAPEELESLFAGLELVEPGFVPRRTGPTSSARTAVRSPSRG
jgi:hypothetical protein